MSAAALIVVGPPSPIVSALLLRNRVRLAARSAERETWQCHSQGTARTYPMAYVAVGHDGKGHSTVLRVSIQCVSARLVFLLTHTTVSPARRGSWWALPFGRARPPRPPNQPSEVM